VRWVALFAAFALSYESEAQKGGWFRAAPGRSLLGNEVAIQAQGAIIQHGIFSK